MSNQHHIPCLSSVPERNMHHKTESSQKLTFWFPSFAVTLFVPLHIVEHLHRLTEILWSTSMGFSGELGRSGSTVSGCTLNFTHHDLGPAIAYPRCRLHTFLYVGHIRPHTVEPVLDNANSAVWTSKSTTLERPAIATDLSSRRRCLRDGPTA